MINGYELLEINGEKTLLLKLDFSFEIGNFDKSNTKNLVEMVKEYLNKINFKSSCDKIVLTISGVILATMIYTKNGDLKQVPNDNINLDNEISMVEDLNKVDKKFNYTVENSDKNVKDEQKLGESNNFTVEKKENQSVSSNINTTSDNNKLKQDIGDKNNSDVNKEDSVSKKEDNQNLQIDSSENKVDVKENFVVDKNEQDSSTLIQTDTSIDGNKNYVTVYRSSGKSEQIELEEYITGVVAAEMPASFSIEALKAQAVVARTYALRKVQAGEKLTDTVSTQAYIDTTQMKTKWGASFSKYYNKIKDCVIETKGEYITYNGDYINAVYHSTSNGYTEDAINVWNESYPYLKSVESSWDKSVSSYQKSVTKELDQILKLAGLNNDELQEIRVISRNASGRVEKIQVGSKIYTGVEFRNLLGLRSTDFDIIEIDGKLNITTRGYGHGVGKSQYGANGMAKEGYNYKQIIKHYYTGVQIQK